MNPLHGQRSPRQGRIACASFLTGPTDWGSEMPRPSQPRVHRRELLLPEHCEDHSGAFSLSRDSGTNSITLLPHQ